MQVTDEPTVFPAWAGMNRESYMLLRSIVCVPRVGGDEPTMARRIYEYNECSPRGRG